MKIDTILASGDVTTGNAAPLRSLQPAQEQLAGAEALGRGFEAVAQDATTIGRHEWIEKRRLAQRQEYDNRLWAESTFTSSQRDWTQWSNDVQKTGSENVVDQFNTDFPKYMTDKAKGAPTPEAANMYKQRMGELGNHIFGNSLKIEGAHRAQNTVNSFSNMLLDSTDTIAQDPESYAKIQANMRGFIKSAQEGERITPAVALTLNQHTDNLAAVAAEAIVGKNPDRAQQILDSAKGLEWPRRKAIEGEITRARNSNDSLLQYQQTELLKSHVDSIEQTGQGIPGFDITRFALSRKGDQQAASVLQATKLIEQAKQTYVGTQSLQGQTPAQLDQTLTALQPKSGDPEFSTKMAVFNKVAQAAKRQETLYCKDPFTYSRQDPVVNKAWHMVEQLPKDALPQYQHQITDQALSASVNWQRDRGIPDARISVMSHDTAGMLSQRINAGDLDTVQKTLGGMKQTYGKYFPMAFHDLVSLPQGQRISAAMQVVALHQGKPFLQDFLAAVRTPMKDMAIEQTDKTLLDQKLLTDPAMLSFKAAMLSANPGNMSMTSEFHDATAKYAQSLFYSGKVKTIPDAVRMATEQVIGSAYGFASVGGVPVAVRRDLGQNHFSDEDVHAIGSGLQHFMPTIDPGKVDVSKFSFPDGVSGIAKTASIKRTITNDSFWVTNPANDGAQLYMNGMSNSSAPIKWRDGSPVQIKFADALNMEKQRRAGNMAAVHAAIRETMQYQPRDQ